MVSDCPSSWSLLTRYFDCVSFRSLFTFYFSKIVNGIGNGMGVDL